MLVVVVGRGWAPGMVPPIAVVAVVVATTCCRAAVVVVKVMVKGKMMTRTRFPDPG